ncbi:branched-chain amino acid ABC transporter permease [Nocardioides speluncae]|uniref:branched-chain amino acid ABC transporter permease n=1 Tax=Nocardioides speluncae TaxID=2670337 RepID=UPI000D689BCA|nr:branched-chain amino acid ABC transporter permease [Nocardioides speluncae]
MSTTLLDRYATARKALADNWANGPIWVKLPIVLALISFCFYLPYLNILPFAQIRTDLGAGGTDWSSVLFLIVIYMIAAVGLNVVIGLAGLLDLGYVGFYALGAYSVALFGSPSSPVTEAIARKFDLSEGWAVPFAACIPIAIAFALVAGVILGAPTLRLRGDYLAIVTMGFGEIIRIILRNSEFTGGPSGVIGIPKPPGPEQDGRDYFNSLDVHRWYWLALIVLILLMFAVRRLEHSRVGRSWLAIREDEDAAAIMGVPAFKFKLWAFAIGAALGAIAGLLFASKQGVVEPNGFRLNLSFLFVAMVVIGGSGNMVGVLIGAFLITYLPERFRGFEQWRPFAFGVALVAVMVLRPQGLVPNRRRAKEFEDRRHEAKEAAADV